MRPAGSSSAILAGAIVLVRRIAAAAPTGYDISTLPGELNSIDLADGCRDRHRRHVRTDGRCGGVAFRPTGRCSRSNEQDAVDSLNAVDVATGTATHVGPLGIEVESSGLTFGADGRLWMTSDDDLASTRSIHDGCARPRSARSATRAGSPTSSSGSPPARGTIYGIGGITNQSVGALFTLDTATGAATLVGPTVEHERVGQGLAFDGDGVLWASAFGDGTYTVDPATGVATPVAVLDYGFEDRRSRRSCAVAQPPAPPTPPAPPSPEPVVVTPTFTG